VLLDACLEVGCHYADIADDRVYASLVRNYGDRFRQRGLAAVYGCSSLPAISGALALTAGEPRTVKPERVRVTLFIGNDNPKGRAAIHSLVSGFGKPICAPQGILRGFRDGESVCLPTPFGERAVYNFDSPEYDLFPGLLGTKSVTVKVGFESRLVTRIFVVLAGLGLCYGRRTANSAALIGRIFPRFGSSGCAVRADLFFAGGAGRSATLFTRANGQRMAALPCALVVRALCEGNSEARGALTAYEFLGADNLLKRLVAEGCALQLDSHPPQTC
jgi:hypothetical protein